MALLIVPTFLAAFLLFQIELIVAKLFLPYFGGSYLVWGACLVFFQAILLAGYIFAHALLQRLSIRSYLKVHLGLLIFPLLFFPLRDVHLSFNSSSLPLVIDIFWRLSMTIGPVFFVLATMSLVTQSWLASSRLKGHDNPYGLYAVSNLGSFMALLTYPFICELYLTNTEQLQIWRVLYFILVIVNVLAVFRIKTEARSLVEGRDLQKGGADLKQILQWLCLGAAGVVMFMSVTNIITYEVAPVPLLWVFPLGIYLMAFVFNFKREPWCPSWITRSIIPIIGVQVMMYFLSQKHFIPVIFMIPALCGLLFLTCMYTQHRLLATKPASSHQMTFFYVMISLGGFLGGVLTSWIMPVVSNTLMEYLTGLLLVALTVPQSSKKPSLWLTGFCVLLSLGAFYLWPHIFKEYHFWSFLLLWAAVLLSFSGLAFDKKIFVTALIGIILATPYLESIWQGVHFIAKKRNYYGIYEIYDTKQRVRVFVHGTTLHGVEFVDQDKHQIPLGYYSPSSAIGSLLIDDIFQAKRIGVVGLGSGTLAMYAKPDCPVDFYELDPDVRDLTLKYFWYLQEAPGKVNVLLGDARLSLRKAPEGAYDLLAIDAFSGDAIPTHLVNKDVLAEYRHKLAARGAVVFHITNRYLNLEPVLAKMAADSHAYAAVKDVGDQGLNMRSIWVVLTWDVGRFVALTSQEDWQPLLIDTGEQVRLWSDDYSSILPIINRQELTVLFNSFKPLK